MNGPSHANSVRARQRRDRIFHMIAAAAEQGRPCPTDDELCLASGLTSRSAIWRVLAELREEGRLRIKRAGRFRLLQLPGTLCATTTSPSPPAKRLPVREIIEIVADVFHVRTADVYGPSRLKRHVRPRQVVSYAAVRHGWSSCHTGRVLELDHSTVLYGRDRCVHFGARDDVFAARLIEVEQRIADALGAIADRSVVPARLAA